MNFTIPYEMSSLKQEVSDNVYWSDRQNKIRSDSTKYPNPLVQVNLSGWGVELETLRVITEPTTIEPLEGEREDNI